MPKENFSGQEVRAIVDRVADVVEELIVKVPPNWTPEQTLRFVVEAIHNAAAKCWPDASELSDRRH